MIAKNIPGKLVNFTSLNYLEALNLMHSIVKVKKVKQWPEILLLLEHPTVITRGRSSTQNDLNITPEALRAKGIAIYDVERGGLATYHGPGQLVGYLIFDLRKINMSPSDLVNSIEIAIIKTLSHFNISASQKDGYRGVWVKNKKIASIGIAVQSGITFHGFALNCNPDLSHFDFINPCGLTQGVMTSASRIRNKTITPDDMKKTITQELQNQTGISFSSMPSLHLLAKLCKERELAKSA